MALKESINIPGHYNIYTGNFERELRIDFCIPENGTNEQTGILLFVPGFSGNIDSKIYVKMRDYFSDKYNLVTVQCNYFGSKYMQTAHNVQLKGDFSTIAHYFNESAEEFADLGFMRTLSLENDEVEKFKKHTSKRSNSERKIPKNTISILKRYL